MPPGRAAKLQGIRLPQSTFASPRIHASFPAAIFGRREPRLRGYLVLLAVVALATVVFLVAYALL